MTTPVSAITRKSFVDRSKPLNILCAPTHERYESNLSKTGHNFYAFQANGFKGWDEAYAKIPDNYHILDGSLGIDQLPEYIDFDLILSQSKFGQYQIFAPLARKMQVSHICIEHTLPQPAQRPEHIDQVRDQRADINLYLWKYSQSAWNADELDNTIISHGMDLDFWKLPKVECRRPVLLSVVNDWINRDWCCGYNLWKEVSKDLPTFVVGNTPGLSEPAKSIEELRLLYQTSSVFLNTSTISSMPLSLVEAMCCGCAIVTTETCGIPEVIEHGKNGLMSNDPKELRRFCEDLLKDEDRCRELGIEARKTAEKMFTMDKFVNEWNDVFYRAAEMPFFGE